MFRFFDLTGSPLPDPGEGEESRVIQFSAPALGGFLPPPETGEGWGGGEEFGSQHPGPLPPHPCLPPRWGEGADAAVMHGEKRELNGPGEERVLAYAFAVS